MPALVGYLPGSEISGALDDVHYLNHYELLLLWGLAIAAANVCFCFAYALEFLYGSDDSQSRWLRYGRSMAFAVGTILGLFLAFQGGVAILRVEYGP